MVSKLSSREGESFNIKSSGIAQWKMFAIIDATSKLLGSRPTWQATDEMGKTIDAADVSLHKNIAHLRVEHPNKTSLYSTSVSGINIHCPNLAIFNQFATEFSRPTPIPDF